MNEQMKELLDWAKDHARIYVIECELANIPFDQEEYDRRFQEKFAELIVKECMSVADFPKNLTGQWDHLESSEVIAAHFGLDK